MITFLDKLPAIIILPLAAFLIYIALLGLLMPIFILSIKTDIHRILKILQELQPDIDKYIKRPAAYRFMPPPRQPQK